MKWIRRISTYSPLEKLELISDHPFDRGPCIGFDGLLDHLGTRHGRTLRFLCLPHAFVGLDALQKLCSRCSLAEEISIGTAASVLVRVPLFDHFGPCSHFIHQVHLHDVFSPCTRLHTLEIFTPQTRPSKVSCDALMVSDLMQRMPILRRFRVNKTFWTVRATLIEVEKTEH